MANRQRPSRVPYDADLTQGITDAFSAKTVMQEIGKTYGKTVDYIDQVSKSIVETNRQSAKRIAANSATTVDDMLSSMDKSLKRTTDNATRNLDKLHTHAIASAKKFHQATESSGASLFGKAAIKSKEIVSHNLVESLAEIGEDLGKLAPAITVFGSVALFVKSLIDRVFELDKASTQLSMSFGGKLKAAQSYMEGLDDVIKSTRLSKTEILEMGDAFAQAGIPIIGNTAHLHDYMTAVGNLHKVIGVGYEALAKYTGTLKVSGLSADQVLKTYDEMYQNMQRYQLTLQDLNASMNEGDALWSSFGSISGKTIDQLQKDILDTKGMFRAFNVDIKQTGSLLSGIWGDPKTQRRQAGLISAMMGIKGSTAQNELLLNPKQGMQDLLHSAVKYMAKFPSLHLGESFEKLQSMGDDQLNGALNSRQAMMQSMSSQLHIPQEMLSQAVSNFTAFRNTNPTNSIDDWSGKRLVNSTFPGKPGSINDALSTFNNSIDGTMANVNNKFDAVIDNVAMLVTKQMPLVMEKINSLVDFFEHNSPGAVMRNLSSSAKDFGAKMGAGISHLTLHKLTSGVAAPSQKNNVRPFLPQGNREDPEIYNQFLTSYRKEQGLKNVRGAHPDFMKNAGEVIRAARQLGADPAMMMATMMQESGGNAKAAGDGGHSIGLFQLNDWGKGKGLSRAFKEDPYQNAMIAGKEMALLQQHHPGWSRGHIAAAAQRPQQYIDANKSGKDIEAIGYSKSVNRLIPLMEKIIKAHDAAQQTALLKKSNEHLEALVDGQAKHTDETTKRMDQAQLRSMVNQSNSHNALLYNSVA